MSDERRLWSRRGVSFPYIVVCWWASRILMLSWRGCRDASLSRKHDLGPVALWESKNLYKKGKRVGVPPGCGSCITLQTRESDERGGKCFILPSLTQETIHPLEIFLSLPVPPPCTLFFSPSCQPFDSALIPSYPPLTPVSRSQQGLTWLWDPQIPHTCVPPVTINGESLCYKTPWTGLLYSPCF